MTQRQLPRDQFFIKSDYRPTKKCQEGHDVQGHNNVNELLLSYGSLNVQRPSV